MHIDLGQFPVYNIEFEIEPGVWVKGSVHIVFVHSNQIFVRTIMCVVRKETDNTEEDGIYYVRSIGQCRGWR